MYISASQETTCWKSLTWEQSNDMRTTKSYLKLLGSFMLGRIFMVIKFEIHKHLTFPNPKEKKGRKEVTPYNLYN